MKLLSGFFTFFFSVSLVSTSSFCSEEYAGKNITLNEFIISLVSHGFEKYQTLNLSTEKKVSAVRSFLDSSFPKEQRFSRQRPQPPAPRGLNIQSLDSCEFGCESGGLVSAKPVVYIYAERDQRFNVKVSLQLDEDHFTFTYPEHGEGWVIDAQKSVDGRPSLLSVPTGEVYDYLFWESSKGPDNWKEFFEGSIVPKSSMVSFLESSLTKLGLNSREKNDFITYWGPHMQEYDRYAVRFLVDEQCDEIATLDVSPSPDASRRIYMIYRGLEADENIVIPEQILPSFNRTGNTLVEWGGGLLRDHK